MTSERPEDRAGGGDAGAQRTEDGRESGPDSADRTGGNGPADDAQRADQAGQPGAGEQDDATGRAGGRAEEADQQAWQERFLRLAAEYDNFRKRTERERGESWVRAQAELVKKLLDPLDDLQRVADYTAEGAGIETLLEGVQMVERKLLRALEGAGMEVIDASGQPFDPAVHEALMTGPASAPDEDDSVGEVLQKGYGFKGVLLRPARVQVRKYDG